MTERPQQILSLNNWLIGDGRVSGDAVHIVEEYVSRLLASDVPVTRARIAQRLSNPLLMAWGIIWTPEGATVYTVPRTTLETSSWIGSPFEYVLTNNRPLHKPLTNLKPDEHEIYHDFAASGGTDFYASIIRYGDGTTQGCSFLTEHPKGFKPSDLEFIEATLPALAAALEPIAMRRSNESLLKVYLGNDPAAAVIDGAIQRGQQIDTKAAIMFADLRGFTHKSVNWSASDLLLALDDYFETVVDAVHEHSGDVLKLLGDGVLAMFPVDESETSGCNNALNAARSALSRLEAKNRDRLANGHEAISAGIGLTFGPVTYGNIGSHERLDFTIVGETVNRASRIQDLCKSTGNTLLFDKALMHRTDNKSELIGNHELNGLPGEWEVYRL